MGDINFERRGSGEPLVLFHGIGHRWQAWEPVLDRLAAHHDVIAIDLPGFGASPEPLGGVPGMEKTVVAMGEFFASLGLDRPHVAGNSLGGAIALELGAAGLASTVTAFAPAGFYTPWERRYAIGLLRVHRFATRVPALRVVLRSATVRRLSFGSIMARPQHISPEVAYLDAVALRDGVGFDSVARSSRRYRFYGQPTVPVTIAWGTRDHVLPYRQADRARLQLPQARHVDLPGSGHVPMSDAADLVTRLILETTASRSARGTGRPAALSRGETAPA